jgi:integrase
LQAALSGLSYERERTEPQPLEVGQDAEDGYIAFSKDDLQQLFHPVFYTAHAARNAARYWIPLLGRMTGCRLKEISQANVRDIRSFEGIHCLFVTSADRDADGKVLPVKQRMQGTKRLKTKGGRRAIPLHPELIRLGFPDYLQERVSVKAHFLFDLTWMPKDGFGKYSGRDFRNLPEAVGIWERKRKVFHSFRSTINQELDEVGLEGSLIERFLGHSIKSIRHSHCNRNREDKTMPLRRVHEALSWIEVESGIPGWAVVRKAERKQLIASAL